MSDNYYDLLGVEPSASRDELRDAYRTRVDELTAAREKKGVSESQLQDNRAEVARVRAAWNVLSDPFQRQRYDAQVTADDGAPRDGDGANGVEIVDDDAGNEVQLTGWRRLMAPPPPKQSSGSGAGGKQPPPRGAARQPTIPLPPGMQIAQSKARGMALLFDLAVVLVILYAVQFVVPNLIQADYKDKVDQIQSVDKASSAQDDIKDAKKSISDANQAIAKAQDSGTSQDVSDAQDDKKSAQQDLQDARKSFNDAQQDFNDKQASQDLPKTGLPTSTTKLDDISSQLSDDIRTTQYLTALATLVLALIYLVPITVKTGSTLGMRGRKIKVVRTDGSRAGWYPVFFRFLIPVLIALAVPTLGPIIGLGIVLWGYRDPNGQGVHDKLARTLVVDA
ncbi:MAG TPA: RDD family protein [Acidimicrobiia bacterium]|nr:RDD family protein [Acidimicrobiia bacterium]